MTFVLGPKLLLLKKAHRSILRFDKNINRIKITLHIKKDICMNTLNTFGRIHVWQMWFVCCKNVQIYNKRVYASFTKVVHNGKTNSNLMSPVRYFYLFYWECPRVFKPIIARSRQSSTKIFLIKLYMLSKKKSRNIFSLYGSWSFWTENEINSFFFLAYFKS